VNNKIILCADSLTPSFNEIMEKIKEYSTEEMIFWAIETDIAEKSLILEESILRRNQKIVHFFHRSLAKTNCPTKPFIHILMCRQPNEASSYSISSASLKSNGRIRVAHDKKWTFYNQDDEWIMNIFEREQEKMIRRLSQKGMYMIVSNGDNSIRIIPHCVLDEVNTLRNEKNLRQTTRGKRIESFSSLEIYNMISFFINEDLSFQMRKKDMKNVLVHLFVSTERYVIL
jgi:hypothetical protein